MFKSSRLVSTGLFALRLCCVALIQKNRKWINQSECLHRFCLVCVWSPPYAEVLFTVCQLINFGVKSQRNRKNVQVSKWKVMLNFLNKTIKFDFIFKVSCRPDDGCRHRRRHHVHFRQKFNFESKEKHKKFHLWHKHVFYKDTVRKEWAWGLVVKVLDVDYMGTAG